MKAICLSLAAIAAVASAAEVAIPDACRDGVCLGGVRWKKGFLEHTIVGTVSAESGVIESAVIVFRYSDNGRHGDGVLRLTAISKPRPFYFKINTAYVKWDQSRVELDVSAIRGIEPMRGDWLTCEFASTGSRLSVIIKNGSQKDVVLDYQLLTLTSGGKNLKLNGTHGKFTDLSTPDPPTLIGQKSEQHEVFMPIGAASFEGGEWVEDWRMFDALLAESPTLTISIGEPGEQALKKIPLEVKMGRLKVSGGPPVK